MTPAPLEAVFYTRYAATGGSSRTRAFEYVEPLRAHGIDACIVSRVNEHGEADPAAFGTVCERAAGGAVVVVQKPNLTFAQLNELLDAGDGRLVVDFDDAIWMGYGPGEPADGLPSLEATLARARLVTTGSRHLAAWAQQRTASEVHVLPPSLDLRRYRHVHEHAQVASRVACWIGTSGNFRDFEPVSGALRALMDSGVVRLCVISDRPLDEREWPAAEFAPWSFEREVVELAGCDLGIMPLRDDERTRGRCGYKALQYPPPASPWSPPPSAAQRKPCSTARRASSLSRRVSGLPRSRAWRAIRRSVASWETPGAAASPSGTTSKSTRRRSRRCCGPHPTRASEAERRSSTGATLRRRAGVVEAVGVDHERRPTTRRRDSHHGPHQRPGINTTLT